MMAAFLAFGKTLDENIIGNIFSLLDDSSLVINGSRDANDIGNLDDLAGVHWLEFDPTINRYASIEVMIYSMEQAALQHSFSP